MVELAKNIGLGLFVNSSYSLMHGAASVGDWYILAAGVAIMGACIYAQGRSQR